MDEFTKNYLSHHGILGQKWGVRRYQNKDGSLTSQGKKRANKRAENKRNELVDQADRIAKSSQSSVQSLEKQINSVKKRGYEYFEWDEWSDSDVEAVFGVSKKKLFDMELSQLEESHNRQIETAKKWLEYRDDLKNMDLSGMSKKDVKREAIKIQQKRFNDD